MNSRRCHGDMFAGLAASNHGKNVVRDNSGLSRTGTSGFVGPAVGDIAGGKEVGVLGVLELQSWEDIDKSIRGVDE